jgi:hypothetical protein
MSCGVWGSMGRMGGGGVGRDDRPASAWRPGPVHPASQRVARLEHGQAGPVAPGRRIGRVRPGRPGLDADTALVHVDDQEGGSCIDVDHVDAARAKRRASAQVEVAADLEGAPVGISSSSSPRCRDASTWTRTALGSETRNQGCQPRAAGMARASAVIEAVCRRPCVSSSNVWRTQPPNGHGSATSRRSARRRAECSTTSQAPA